MRLKTVMMVDVAVAEILLAAASFRRRQNELRRKRLPGAHSSLRRWKLEYSSCSSESNNLTANFTENNGQKMNTVFPS
jgi:hypothetical protein